MPFVAAKCPNCGGNLVVDSLKKAAVCPYCQGAFIVEEAINNITLNVENLKADVVKIHDDHTAEARLKAGEAFLTIRNWDKADKAFQEVCDLTPQDYRGWWGKIRARTQEFTARQIITGEINALERLFTHAMTFAPEREKPRLMRIFEPYINRQEKLCRRYQALLAERRTRVQERIDVLQSDRDYWNGKNYAVTDILFFLDHNFFGVLCVISLIWGAIRFLVRRDSLSVLLLAVPVIVIIALLIHNGCEKSRIEVRSRRMETLDRELGMLRGKCAEYQFAEECLRRDPPTLFSSENDRFQKTLAELHAEGA